MSSVPFVGHEVDSICGPQHDASKDRKHDGIYHSQHAHSLNEIVATANKQATKSIIWTIEGLLQGFDKIKTMVNSCPKLYFINNTYKLVLYMDPSDYGHGAYLSQLVPTGDMDETREEPIRSSLAHLVKLKDGRQSKKKLLQCTGLR